MKLTLVQHNKILDNMKNKLAAELKKLEKLKKQVEEIYLAISAYENRIYKAESSGVKSFER